MTGFVLIFADFDLLEALLEALLVFHPSKIDSSNEKPRQPFADGVVQGPTDGAKTSNLGPQPLLGDAGRESAISGDWSVFSLALCSRG